MKKSLAERSSDAAAAGLAERNERSRAASGRMGGMVLLDRGPPVGGGGPRFHTDCTLPGLAAVSSATRASGVGSNWAFVRRRGCSSRVYRTASLFLHRDLPSSSDGIGPSPRRAGAGRQGGAAAAEEEVQGEDGVGQVHAAVAVRVAAEERAGRREAREEGGPRERRLPRRRAGHLVGDRAERAPSSWNDVAVARTSAIVSPFRSMRSSRRRSGSPRRGRPPRRPPPAAPPASARRFRTPSSRFEPKRTRPGTNRGAMLLPFTVTEVRPPESGRIPVGRRAVGKDSPSEKLPAARR